MATEAAVQLRLPSLGFFLGCTDTSIDPILCYVLGLIHSDTTAPDTTVQQRGGAMSAVWGYFRISDDDQSTANCDK